MRRLSLAIAAAALSLPALTAAQAQTTPPAASTSATCKDGTTWTGPSHRGACRGHGGVKAFDAAAAAAPTAAAEPAAAPAAQATAPAATPAPATSTPAPATAPAKTASHHHALPANPAPGGGPGKVWVNTGSKTYHCQGDRYYGKTKAGEYMTEEAAKAAGDKPAHNKACSS